MNSHLPAWFEQGVAHAWRPYTQAKTAAPPLPVVGASGVRLHLADGRALVDGISSWWTAVHGYAHPHLLDALHRQADALPHVMFGGLTHEPALRLAKRLADLLPGDLDHVFFSESGSVAVELAMKVCLQYWRQRGVPGKSRFLAFFGGYHGDTLGAASLCDPEEGLHPDLGAAFPTQLHAPLPVDDASIATFESLLAGHASTLAGVVLEPLLQGAGGMRVHGPEVVRRVREACDRHGVLLVLDEIATGFGRTGTLFACEQADVVPDVVTLSKALTGGVIPLSAMVARRHVYDAFLSDDPSFALQHGPTYMANPLACAVANASLDLFASEPRLAQVRSIEAQLREQLAPCRSLAGVRDVRVLGAMGAVQLDGPSPADIARLRARAVELGAWIRPFGDVVYLTPAYVIGGDDLSFLCEVVRWLVGEWSAAR